MPRISDSSKEKVREAVDIVDLVNHYTDLRRNGSQYMGRCPFHEDNSPSFSVNPSDKVYHCFGCGVGGDVFKFVQEKEGLDFAASIEYLADQFNVELEYEELDPKAQERQKERERLFELLERATKFYERTLADSDEAAPAREYLASRGFSPEVLAKFRVGYSPKAWDKLFVPALRQGFTERELMDAGLVQHNRERNQIFDRFRGRIMFPLADKKGIVRGFGARGMRDSDKPKYLNSADGPAYHKGSQIFAINHARRPAAAKKRVIAVEGYADVLALHDAGFEESVAVMGTAMTEQQAAELSRMASRVYLALDADEPGRRAALRAAEVLGAHRDTETLVIQVPDGKDPDELIKQGGPQAFEEAMSRAVTVAEFAVSQVFAAGDLSTAREREHVLDDLVPVFNAMAPGPVKEEQMLVAADRLGISEGVLRESLRERAQNAPMPRPQAPQEIEPPPASKPVKNDPRERSERIFLAQCLSNAPVGRDYLERLQDDDLSTPLMRELRDHLRNNAENPLANLRELKPELQSAVTEVAMLSEREHASAEVIQLGFLLIEKAGLDRKITGAPGDQKAEIELKRQELIRKIGELSAEFA
ncbi:MAG: DNA primase [Solirubrobacterales bacterium]|nr:DNA primase [Solirubrobacterales bacterium]